MKQDNYIQQACRNASLHANALDKYQLTFEYDNMPEDLEEYIYAAYGFLHHVGYQYNHEEIAGVKNEQGKVKFGFTFSDDLSYFNASLVAPHFNSFFENIGLHHQLRPFLVQHPAYNQLKFYSPEYFYTKHYGMLEILVIDITKASIVFYVFNKFLFFFFQPLVL